MMDEGFPNFDIGDVESLFASSGHFSVSLVTFIFSIINLLFNWGCDLRFKLSNYL